MDTEALLPVRNMDSKLTLIICYWLVSYIDHNIQGVLWIW